MPATRSSHGVGSLVVHDGFPPSSHCRPDDELVIVRREKLQHPCALSNGRSMAAAASSTGRSMPCRGFVAKEYVAHAHATEVGYLSSSRWPHDRCACHMHLWQVPAASSVATCSNCLSTIVCSGCSGRERDAQSVEGRGHICAHVVGPLSTCHRRHQQNGKPHLRENSHACCGTSAAFTQPHDPDSHFINSCPPNKRCLRAQQQKSRAAVLTRVEGPPAPPPPFPSAHGAPYVLCQHCGLLLQLPPGTPLPSRSSPFRTIRCGSCLNFSSFSTRHLYAAPPSGAGVLPPPFSPPKESIDSTSMPGYGAFHSGLQEAHYAVCASVPQANCAIAHANSAEEGINRQNSKKVYPSSDLCNHGRTGKGEITAIDDVFDGLVDPASHAEAGGYHDRASGQAIQSKDSRTVDSLNGASAFALEDRIAEARDCKNPEPLQPQDENIDNSCGNMCELTSDNHRDSTALIISEKLQEDPPWDREQEITIMSSVQSWVDSLSPDTGYESDFSLHCSEKCAIGCEKHGGSVHRPPLHQHFGYKSPLELFEKVISSEDVEMRNRTESNSTASSSSSPNNVCQRADSRVTCLQVRDPSLRGWSGGAMKSDNNSPKSEERDRFLSSKLFKGGLGNHLPKSLKGKVVVNGHVLSTAAVKRAEEQAGKLRPGSYWYDCKAGFWGVEGGFCLGILPPLIEELHYPMAGNCSNGDTQVYVNGRELHSKDLGILSQRGFPDKVGRAYSLGFDGVLVDETTGLEVKHLGKLAPTVERKGKGFGMFAGDMP